MGAKPSGRRPAPGVRWTKKIRGDRIGKAHCLSLASILRTWAIEAPRAPASEAKRAEARARRLRDQEKSRVIAFTRSPWRVWAIDARARRLYLQCIVKLAPARQDAGPPILSIANIKYTYVAKRPFPSKEEVLAFLRESPARVGKREIARAFHIRGDERVALKALIKELRSEGLLERPDKRRPARPGALPEVLVVEVSAIDPDGELIARPAVWHRDEAPPTIYLAPERRGRPAIGLGERVLARLKRIEPGVYEGRPIRVLGGAPKRLLGIYQEGEGGGRLHPTDRRAKGDFRLRREDAGTARPGDLVLAEVKAHHRRLGPREVRVVERLGAIDSPRALSLISIQEHDLPTVFAPEALAAAEACGPVPLGDREDLRDIPLVTIDGADARDFDDAVWAEPDPDNPDGWHVLVAIADVAHYVRPGCALDRAAQERGNSAYFPDRVVPMLPEALSNGWCSLKPGEERPCLAVHLWLDAEGRARRHRFLRGLMRSAARLTYEQVQAARDGRPDALGNPLLEPVIRSLYGAFGALERARRARGTLDLDLEERQVLMDEQGRVAEIAPRPRLDSHRLIEEFMIAANVAAAETLEARSRPAMYRVHEAPDPQKLEAFRQVLATFGLKFARGQVVRPHAFTRILEKVAGKPHAALVSQLVLRTQSKALYSPRNLGHFGLALARYVHFTSPIRRYADLLAHRALIAGEGPGARNPGAGGLGAGGLGAGGLGAEESERFEEIGQHISMTERRAQAAEREALDRFTAAFLQDRVGALFAGRVTGVTRFGLFVQLRENGADCLVPIGSLPEDFYDHRQDEHCLQGRRWGRRYRLGQTLRVRLIEANPLTGGLIAHVADDPSATREETPPNSREGAAAWDPIGAERG